MDCSTLTGLGKVLNIASYLVSLYVIGMFWSSQSSYNSARIEPDTNFLLWTTRLPAISVCQAAGFNSSLLHMRNDELDFIHGLARPRKLMCRKCSAVSSTFKSADLYELALKAIASCKELFKYCLFNGKAFDCCQRFKRLQTKNGICYSINSEMTKTNFRISVSHFARNAALRFFVNFPVQVFIHDRKEVLFLNHKAPVVGQEASLHLLYRSRETVVDPSARDLTVQQRGCILDGERQVRGYPAYSLSSCETECLAWAQVQECGCFHHWLPGPTEGNFSYCDLRGLQCLDYHSSMKKHAANHHNRYETDQNCNCLPSCDQQEVKVIWGQLKRNQSQTILIELISPPTERLVLKSRVEFLDILIGFACFTRLFTSTSVLDIFRAALAWFHPVRSEESYRQILY